MQAMLVSSLLVVGYAFVPVIFEAYGAPTDLAWKGSSVLLLLATLSYYRWLQRAIVTLGRAGLTPTPLQRRIIIPTLLLTLIAVSLLLLANVVVAMPAVYLTGLALLLFQSGFAFTLIVFSFLPPIRSEPAED